MQIEKRVKKILTVPLALFFCVLFLFYAGAATLDGSISKTKSYYYSTRGVSNDAALVEKLSLECGSSAPDWTVIALKRSGYSGSALSYSSALEGKFYSSATNETDKERMSLVFAAIGGGEKLITRTLNTVPGSQGLMSYVYGLILADSRGYDIRPSRDECLRAILSAEIEGGGFALFGNTPDIDVTAMTLISFSVYYGRNGYEDVTAAADRALEVISSRQNEYGDFTSFWTNPPERNSESCAQTVIALSSLGIDCEKDARFIKNGRTLLSALSAYQNPDGGFSHSVGGKTNSIATAQCFLALSAYKLFKNGGGRVFDFTSLSYNLSAPETGKPVFIPDSPGVPAAEPLYTTATGEDGYNGPDETVTASESEAETEKSEETAETSAAETEKTEKDEKAEKAEEKNEDNNQKDSKNSATEQQKDAVGKSAIINKDNPAMTKVILCVFALLSGLSVLYLSYTGGRKKKGLYISVAAITALAIAVILFIPIGGASKETVSVTIDCTRFEDKASLGLPEDGMILQKTETLREGDTAFSLLERVCKENGIEIESKGAGDEIYVISIDSLSEFDSGPLSGWMYSVSGEFPSISCGAYTPKSGDDIKFQYTNNIGKDL